MNFTASRDALQQAIQATARAVPLRSTLPALSGILLQAEADRVTFHATDLEMAISTTIPARVAVPGSILLPAKQLVEIARRIPSESITFDIDPNHTTATLSWTGSEFLLHGQPAEHFPGIPTTDPGAEISIGADQLRTAIESTLFAASQDEARPILTGAQITLADGELRTLATDGFRIASRRLAVPTPPEHPAFNAVLPSRNLAELLRLLSDAESVTILPSGNHVLFRAADTAFLSRTLEGAYPAVLDLVPKEYRASIRVDRLLLHDAFDRVSLFTDPLQKAYATSLAYADGRVVLSASSAAVGKAREELPAEVRGEPGEIIFNARLFTDGLRAAGGNEVTLEISGPLTAARLTAADAEGFMYVIMPMRPSES